MREIIPTFESYVINEGRYDKVTGELADLIFDKIKLSKKRLG